MTRPGSNVKLGFYNDLSFQAPDFLNLFQGELLYKHNLRPSLYRTKRLQAAYPVQKGCFEEKSGNGLACNKLAKIWAQEKDLKDLKGHGPVPACPGESTSTENVGLPRKDRVEGRRGQKPKYLC